MSFDRIPEELKALPQWVVWKYEEELLDNGTTRITKAPYQTNGYRASPTGPNTWADFESVCYAMSFNVFNGIGFVLSKTDPYTIIDLDNKPEAPATPDQLARHQKIYETFQSYTELSVSGTGVHIVLRGAVPFGVHRDNVEVYSDSRFMAFTGNVLRDMPITDGHQQMLDMLYREMQPIAKTTLIDVEGTMDDAELVEMASNAANGEKFTALCNGEWEQLGYPSQSEADFSLLSMLTYYTQDNEQVRRIFRMTKLGKRTKAVKDNKYLDRNLEKIRAQQPPPVDLSAIAAKAQELMNRPPDPETVDMETGEILSPVVNTHTPEPAHVPGVELPPGLIGELAQYFYQTSIRPVPEFALGAALGIISGIAARAYNISGMGLNQYMILLARTGAGKEGISSGIENLISAVRPQLPMIDQFIGPASFASGQALIKALDERPCFVSILGEFGLTLQQICDERANGAERMLRKVLLDLYAKSGWTRTLQPSVYSDVTKNTNSIHAPNVSILGESTPERFFDGLDSSHIAEGLIPRFSVIEYNGPRPPRNPHPNFPPSPELAQKFMNLVVASISMTNNNTCCQVQTSPDAQAMLDQFDTKCDAVMNSSRGEVELQLWNRAHLKALKLSALLAVGVNQNAPLITTREATWAINFVSRDCEIIAKRFKSGDVGKGDSKQYNDLIRVIEAYFKSAPKTLEAYGVTTALINAGVIPYRYLIRRTAGLASFRTDKLGATTALKKTIQVLLDSGMISQIPAGNLAKQFGFSGVAYGVISLSK